MYAFSWNDLANKATGTVNDFAGQAYNQAKKTLIATLNAEAEKFISQQLEASDASFDSMKNDLRKNLQNVSNKINIPGVDTKKVFNEIEAQVLNNAEDIYARIKAKINVNQKSKGTSEGSFKKTSNSFFGMFRSQAANNNQQASETSSNTAKSFGGAVSNMIRTQAQANENGNNQTAE